MYENVLNHAQSTYVKIHKNLYPYNLRGIFIILFFTSDGNHGLTQGIVLSKEKSRTQEIAEVLDSKPGLLCCS